MNRRWDLINPKKEGHFAYIEHRQDAYKYPYKIIMCRDMGSGNPIADGQASAALTLNQAKAAVTRFLGYKTKWEEIDTL